MFESVLQLSLEFTAWLQGLGAWLQPVMEFFTFLGTEDFYLLFMPIILWLFDYYLAFRVGVMLLLTAGINDLAKMIFRQPRPYWLNPEISKASSPSGGYGIPSGHSQTPLSVFGLLAVTFKKRWFTLVATFFVFMIGFSRIYLAEHFITDVLGGWLMGGLVLYSFVKLEPSVRAWFSGKPFAVKSLAVFGYSVGFILLTAVVIAFPNGYQLPQAWVDNALVANPEEPINPLNLSNVITSMATLFGFSMGYFWTESRGGFNAATESWWRRALRFVIGLVGVVIFWMGLGAIFPDDPNLLGWVLRFLRYSLVGFWLTGLAPYLFLRFGLAQPKDR